MGLGNISNSDDTVRTAHERRKKIGSWAVLICVTMISVAIVALVAATSTLTVALVAAYLLVVPLAWFAAVKFSLTRGEARKMVDEMDSNYEAIISMLTGALGLHDSLTLGHSTRVSQLAATVAWQMGLRKEDVRLIEKAAILHDIGKIGIAEDVILKTGTLTERDWSEMKRHPELGYHILRSIGSLNDCAEIVLAHHERFDGQGYPRGLRGDEIPLGARIFALVDAYVAMTSGRPYRKQMTHSMALKEIVRNSLTQFDPEVVDAFLKADAEGLIDPSGLSHEVPDMYGDRVPAEAQA